MPAEPDVVALPFAVVDASAARREWSVSAPVVDATPPTGICARADAPLMVSAIAAATLIGPPEVDADGVLVDPESPVPAALAALFA